MTFKPVKRCRLCYKPIRRYNSSGVCSNCMHDKVNKERYRKIKNQS